MNGRARPQHTGWDSVLDPTVLQSALSPKIKAALLQALVHAEYDFDIEGISMSAFRQTLRDAVRQNAQLMEEHSKLLATVAKEAEKKKLTQEQQRYRQWVETACEGGMKGLYKAIKSPETSMLRRCRDQALEIRPRLRRAEWRDLWIGPKQDGSPLQATLARLKTEAIRQRQEWEDITSRQLKKAIKQMADKTGGPARPHSADA